MTAILSRAERVTAAMNGEIGRRLQMRPEEEACAALLSLTLFSSGRPILAGRADRADQAERTGRGVPVGGAEKTGRAQVGNGGQRPERNGKSRAADFVPENA